jgi:small subunit ribosomal protein S2
MTESSELLIDLETYETHAVHIGTQQKSADMSTFIQEVRSDGLYLLDINITDTRIRTIASFINRYNAANVMVVSARQYGQRPARKFSESVGAKSAVGRFIPGSLTNPALRSYVEPDILMVTDPAADQQALSEAVDSGLPIIAICDANNNLRNVDLVLPANNMGRRSLALIFWLLSREVLKLRGETTDEAWAEANDLEDWESTF